MHIDVKNYFHKFRLDSILHLPINEPELIRKDNYYYKVDNELGEYIIEKIILKNSCKKIINLKNKCQNA